ncbi:hypothetical protein [Anaeromyxobacter oryzae]|uniref:Uncharacterized protein n=1 Tax=Anaeromyxobacter oryzae TaxID=2918170 RepID=A0ABM7WWP1_9BACT|nr:hypothetical protein [Anaeromyxobacter oryzae]BDG03877.1 hypothetical protein AMOR_28730 [Anaeromyxobacter oryzae]
MSLQRDWILRIVEQLAQALARVAGLRKQARTEDAVKELAGAASGLAGIDLHMAASVDAATLAGLVREPVRMAVLARVMLERAEIARDLGDAAGDLAWRRRAVELWLEAGAAGAALDDDARAAIAAHPADALSVRARGLRDHARG